MNDGDMSLFEPASNAGSSEAIQFPVSSETIREYSVSPTFAFEETTAIPIHEVLETREQIGFQIEQTTFESPEVTRTYVPSSISLAEFLASNPNAGHEILRLRGEAFMPTASIGGSSGTPAISRSVFSAGGSRTSSQSAPVQARRQSVKTFVQKAVARFIPRSLRNRAANRSERPTVGGLNADELLNWAAERRSVGTQVSLTGELQTNSQMFGSFSEINSNRIAREIATQAMNSEYNIQDAVKALTQDTPVDVPVPVVAYLKGQDLAFITNFANNAIKLRAHITDIMDNPIYNDSIKFAIRENSYNVRKLIDDGNLDKLKDYWKKTPNTIFYNGQVSLIGLSAPYKILRNFQFGTDSSGLYLAADHNSNRGQRGVIQQDKDSCSAMLLPVNTNKYKDLSNRTQRQDSYNVCYKQKDPLYFLEYRKENLMHRITNDAFVWTVLVDTDNNLSIATKLTNSLYDCFMLENIDNIIPWLETVGLNNYPEINVPVCELFKGMSRFQEEFSKIEQFNFKISDPTKSISDLKEIFSNFQEKMFRFFDFKNGVCEIIDYVEKNNPVKNTNESIVAHIDLDCKLFQRAYRVVQNKLESDLNDRISRDLTFTVADKQNFSNILTKIDHTFSTSMEFTFSLCNSNSPSTIVSQSGSTSLDNYLTKLKGLSNTLGFNYDIVPTKKTFKLFF